MWRNTTAKYARGFHMTFIDIVCFFYVIWCLLNFIVVGGFNPLKNMKVSWDDYSQYMEKKTTCSKPPTRYIYIQNYISNLWKHCKVYQGINHILVLPFILNHPEARGIIGLRHDPNWPYRPEPKSDTKTNTVTSTYPICSMYAIFTYIILHLPQKWPKRR
jgi:hypothetical protein